MKSTIVILATIVVMTSACDIRPSEVKKETNYEIVISMKTPQGEVYSSGVVAFRGESGRGFLRGEAIPLDLPDGRTVFMLITTPFKSWEFEAPWVNKVDLEKVNNGIPARMVHSKLPDFVVFTDKSVPSSVKRVGFENASSVLGEGYDFEEITVARTTKPVSEGILKRLPWVKKLNGNVLGNIYSDYKYQSNIDHSSFRRFM